jgi:hypothetical protein
MTNDEDDNQNPLHRFLNQRKLEDHFPENYKESPIYKKGRREGYDRGIQDAWYEANKVISPIRSILQLHDRSSDDYLDE